MIVRALVCGVTVGLAVAAGALAAMPHVTLADGAWVSGAAVLSHALATLVGTLALAPLVGLRAARGERRARLDWALPSGAACGVLVAALRLRALAGMAQPELVVFAPGPLLEGAVAGLLVGWTVLRLPARASRAAWATTAALALAFAAALGLSEWAAARFAAPYTGRPRPDLLLVSVDTLRADRLGAYGGPAGLTPALDRLAAQATTFERAASPMPLTGPTHTTLLTGLAPSRHGVVRNGVRLRREIGTVVETLARAGYRTGGFIGGWPLTDASSGLAGRFQHYDEDLHTGLGLPRSLDHVPLVWLTDRSAMHLFGSRSFPKRKGSLLGEVLERDGGHTVERALAWIARRDDAPYFAFVHLYEPHVPYTPPAELVRSLAGDDEPTRWRFDRTPDELPAHELVTDASELAEIRRLYDAEVAYVDQLVGRLLAGVDSLAGGEPPVVVFTADHGEGLGEHGEYFVHSALLYETTQHAPLLVRLPGGAGAGGRVDELVLLADVAPTLLELAAVASRGELDGRSLMALVAGGGEPDPGRLGFATSGGLMLKRHGHAMPLVHSVRDRRHKLIWTLDERWPFLVEPRGEELYDLDADPGEQRNLLPDAADPEVVAVLRAALRERLTAPGAVGGRPDPETARRLRALGYL